MIKARTVLIWDGSLHSIVCQGCIKGTIDYVLPCYLRVLFSRIHNISSDDTNCLRQYNTRRLFTTHTFNKTV